MQFATVVRDCLHLNWAVPERALPPLPAPLAYDVHSTDEGRRVFAGAALFRLERLHIKRLPLVRLSYPQLSLRLCVVDGDGIRAHFLPRVLVPGWAVPAARLAALKPVRTGVFDYPEAGPVAGTACRWRVRRRGSLELTARLAAPGGTGSAQLDGWRETVRHLDHRPYGYFCAPDALRRLEIERPRTEPVPVAVEIERLDLVARGLGLEGLDSWPPLHSAWYSPEIPHVFEVAIAPEAAVRRQVPAPG